MVSVGAALVLLLAALPNQHDATQAVQPPADVRAPPAAANAPEAAAVPSAMPAPAPSSASSSATAAVMAPEPAPDLEAEPLLSSAGLSHVAPLGDVAALGAAAAPLDDDDADVSDDDETEESGGDGEADAQRGEVAIGDPEVRYSADLSDEELERRFTHAPQDLGTISVGYCDAGRLVNAVHLPPGDHWNAVVPENAWGTQETIDALMAVADTVHAQVPLAPPLRVNHISKRDGGYLRPHHSHQSGRDVDLGFYFPPGTDLLHLPKRRDQLMDLDANWALIKALATQADVEVVLVDRRIQKLLYAHALKRGEDPAWLELLFHAGRASLVQHARRHRDHFHVRFYSPRSQELGRRVQPILAKWPEQNLAIHKVKRGDTLSHIALRYGSTVKLIQSKNGLKGTLLRVGRTLTVPLRGPCTKCPLPPPVVMRARRLPPVSGPPAEAPAAQEPVTEEPGVPAATPAKT